MEIKKWNPNKRYILITIESGCSKKNSTQTGRARPGMEILDSVRQLGKGMGVEVTGVGEWAEREAPVPVWRKTVKRI